MTIIMPWDRSSHDEVDDVCIPGGVARDGKEMLVGECVIDVSSTSNVETRLVLCHQVLDALLVFDLQVEFLKEQHPSYKSWFGLFLGEQVFQGCMVVIDNNLTSQDVRPELLECVDHHQKLFFRR